MASYDAIIVGSGPNGLAAAITLAHSGRRVLVVESHQTVGGGMRSAELTLPGFVHDVCSAVHPLAVASPFMQSLPLEKHGLRWIYSEASAAHAFADRPAVIVRRSIAETATLPGPGVHGMCGYHAARTVSASVLHNCGGHEQTRTAS